MPPGLAHDDLEELYSELRRMGSGLKNYYWTPDSEHMFQGDAFEGAPFPIFNAEGVSLKTGRVLLLSNTCDVSEENKRDQPIRVTVAPVVSLDRLAAILNRGGASNDRVESRIRAVRQHSVNSMFLMERGAGIKEDSVVLFDQIQSLPLSLFAHYSPRRVATLSQAAHWILLVKISIHFSRLQEKVRRRADPLKPVAID